MTSSTPTHDSALVFALPSDSVEAIAANVRATGAATVQLLLPDGARALRSEADFVRLRAALHSTASALLVISADDTVLHAARRSGFDTVGVQGARVLAPGETTAAPTPDYTTQPLVDDDRAFLDALEFVDVPYDDEPQPAPARSSRRETTPRPRITRPIEPVPAAGWDDEAEQPEPPRRGREQRRTGTQRSGALLTDGRDVPLVSRDQLARSRLARDLGYGEYAAPPRRQVNIGRVLLPLLLIAALVGAPLAYYFFTRATITVALPPNTANDVAFQGEVIPLTFDAVTTQATVRAASVSAPASFTLDVPAGQTLTPVGVARGNVTIYSALGQAIDLPQGTQFIAQNAQGQPVPFLLDSPATIPPAVSNTTIAGTTITNGRIEVAVSAASPGSASNVGENTVTQIVIPGQQPITNGGNINVTNVALVGGDEQNVAVVTEQSVQDALDDALSGLYRAGVDELTRQLPNGDFEVDSGTLRPNAQALGDPANYDPPVVEPPIGTQLDQNTPTFKLTVRATFSALAIPRGQPISSQLERVVPAYFNSKPAEAAACKPGQNQIGFTVAGWRWDGERLAVDGAVTCQTTQQEQAIRSRVLQAVRGQGRDAADARLGQLQADGVIANYAIEPADRSQFSRFDPLLEVRVTGASSAPPAQGQPNATAVPSAQPTAGAQP